MAIIDTRLLVAVPASAWHRQTARRVLPTEGFQKIVPVDVLQCSVAERGVPLDSSMRVWMGFMDASIAGELVSADDVECLDHQFLAGASPGCLPFASGLVDAAQEYFAFLSAEEPQLLESGGAAGGSGLDMEIRMEQMERTMAQIGESLQSLVTSSKGRVKFASEVERPSALKAPPQRQQTEKYPDLDPSVVSAALTAGVSEAALMEMQKMIGVGLPKAKKLPEPGLNLSPKRKARKDVLSESESEEEEGDAGDGGLLDGSSPPSVARSLKQLTKIVSALTMERRKKSQVSSSGLTETGSLGSGKKAAAARRVLRSSLLESPEEIYQLVERYMKEDLSLATQTPGQPVPVLSARAWIERRSKIGNYKTSAHCAWSAGGILDALIAGNTALARARASLLVLMLVQTAVDRGSWVLSSELSLEPPPPLSVLALHTPPNVGDGELPFSRLLDPRWAEVCLAHLREAEDYVSRRSKLERKEAETIWNPPKQKARPKQKRRPAEVQSECSGYGGGS